MRSLSQITFIFVIFLAVDAVAAQSASALTYSQLIEHPENYAGKRVKVTAKWFVFFEVSGLHSANEKTPRADWAWVDFEENDKLCRGSGSKLRSLGKKYSGDSSVTFVGTLYTGASFGHMGGYKYRFLVDCVESVSKLPKDQRLKE